MTQNQYPDTVQRLAPQIQRVKEELAAGGLPSEIANSLHAMGMSNIDLILIFREATGASIRDLKGLGQWWSRQGVTDLPAFDAWAAEAFARGAVRCLG